MLRYGTRISVDFDFFGPRPLDKEKLRAVLPIIANGKVLQDEADTLTLIVRGVKLSFFGVGIATLEPPELTDDGVILVASPLDLLANKLKAILQRAEAKDYYDIAALLNNGISLSNGLAGARTLFGQSFQVAEALKALTYFGDGDLASVDMPTRTLLRNAVDEIRSLF